MDYRYVLTFVCRTLILIAAVAVSGCSAPSVERPQPAVGDASKPVANGTDGVGDEESERGVFRVHRLNSKGQMVRNRWTRNSERPGCHDLFGARAAYKIAQIGFAWCTVYSAGDCAPGSELGAKWRGDRYRRGDIDIEQPQTRILQGANWFLSTEEEKKNVEIGSWRCEY